jgi:hypothetical protein
MFSKPEYGWTDVTVGDFTCRASYLEDIPVMCMKAFTNALSPYPTPACMLFDAEGWYFYIVSSFNQTFVIEEIENDSIADRRLRKYNVKLTDIAQEVINDIEQYFEEWINWECWKPLSEDEYNERKTLLTKMLEDLKSELSKRLAREQAVRERWYKMNEGNL